MTDSPAEFRLASIHVYPLKSGRGVRVDEAEVAETGLRHDRRWMITDEAGRFLTQRQDPRLARIVPTLERDALRLSAPNVPDLLVALDPSGAPGEPVRVRVWGDEVAARRVGREADAWLEALLGAPRRLVRFGPEADRPVDPDVARPDDRVAFADGFPFLLTGAASLDDLNARMTAPLEMERFRPNLVVSGAPPFDEDDWRVVRVGNLPFRVVKPCVRCSITTVDPVTAEVGNEPLRTLATFRRTSRGVTFGQNAIHDATGMLRTGDPVRVLRRA